MSTERVSLFQLYLPIHQNRQCFQLPVANAVPGDKDYSPIWESNFVTWNDNATARELKSVEEILAAQSNGELTIAETDIIVNSPAVNYTAS